MRPERAHAPRLSAVSTVKGEPLGAPTTTQTTVGTVMVAAESTTGSTNESITELTVESTTDLIVDATVKSIAASTARAASRRSGYCRLVFGLDVVAAVIAVGITLTGSSRVLDLAFCVGLVLVWPLLVAANGGYERSSVGAGNAEFSRIFRAFLHTTALAVFASFLLNIHPSRTVAVPSLALLFVSTCVLRFAARKGLHRRRKHGKSLTPVVAVGDAQSVVEFTTLLRRDRFVGMDVVGACLVAPARAGTAAAAGLRDLGIADLGRLDDVSEVARRFDAPTVAVLDGSIGSERLKRVAWQLEGSRADLVISPGLAELGGRRMHVRPVAGLPLLHIDEPRFSGGRRAIKGAFDVVTAAVALLLLSPLLLVIGLLIRATSRGPALFRQTRVGRGGREFTMYKFRSMCVDAEDRLPELVLADNGNGVLFKLHHDPRVTSVGRVLRRFSLDELPQLLNVLSGAMSLVGPRPPLPDEVARYHDDAHRRLLVKPGLTGLWQISGRSNLSWEESIRLDLHYVEQWSLSLDLIVLWKTARAVLKADGAY